MQCSPRLKKLRTGLQAASSSHLITGGTGFMDLEESVRSPKVLQGQENTGFMSLYYGRDTVTKQPGFEMISSPIHPNLASAGARKMTAADLMRVHPPSYAGFAEPNNRFPRVLQGQEICPLRSLTGKVDISLNAWGKPSSASCNPFNLHQATRPKFDSLGSEVLQTAFFPYGDLHKAGHGSSMLCSKPSSFQRDSAPFNTPLTQAGIIRNEIGRSGPSIMHEQKLPENVSMVASLGANSMRMPVPDEDNLKGKINGCKLFGVALCGETTTQNIQNSAKRSCTKVSDDR
ncbi:hypothetical protein PIB30_096000 [Stylosanthes scabra]|uniref:Uncharacterized protein n=1 Tax=Stylosanthes scabra TaxID=79078 RepID=A0ABU6QV92_9FABA|nr:hypothetical protein [Stylosanthes scabra]